MKKNNKGFTLIELLAVIVILGILLAIAIPSVAKYINTARKSTYVENVQSYARAAKNEVLAVNSKYVLPVNAGEATVITFSVLQDALENGGKTSPYGGTWSSDSYVAIVNKGTAEEPKYVYYIAAIDSKGYGIGSNKSAAAIIYEDLQESNILQLGGTGISAAQAATTEDFEITASYSLNEDGTIKETLTPSSASGLIEKPQLPSGELPPAEAQIGG